MYNDCKWAFVSAFTAISSVSSSMVDPTTDVIAFQFWITNEVLIAMTASISILAYGNSSQESDVTLSHTGTLQLAAIAALPDDQCIALAQEQNFAAVPAYLQHSSDPASRQSMTNNEAPGRPLTLALCPQSMRVSTAGPSSIHSSTSVAHISVTNEIEFIKEKEKAPPHSSAVNIYNLATKSAAWAKVFEMFVKAGGVKDTRAQILKDKIKELLDCHEILTIVQGAQRKAPITIAMRKFLDNEENAIALGSTLDAVANETASASVVRCEKEKKKTED
ncbi:hypothetical protein BDP27DRAFT_1365304 [Rhodocollybia butyracea]|uniref:Uncharacterized protein n=1 Tax=Rhodocollybia butyracea TaxID=206335 RepID=A0A9P5PPE7_9AGAR|nr:hypothetical protein BDP27DRAFT_1365304 [Rhodocollybia butyracea]